MKNNPLIRIIFIIAIMSISLLMTACPKPAEPVIDENEQVPVVPDEQDTAESEITATVELMDVIDWSEVGDDSAGMEPTYLFNVKLHNVDPTKGEMLGVDFLYMAHIPTGETSYVLNDPSNPESGWVSDSSEPIPHEVTDTFIGRVDSLDSITSTERVFDIIKPDGAVSLEYWVEVYTVSSISHGEEVIEEGNFVTMDVIDAQGGTVSEP